MVANMPLSGQLTKDRFGYAMPVDAPLYTPFPVYYEDLRILMFPYLTDAAAAAALLPSQFELIPADPDGKFAIAQVVFAKYPFSNMGAYNEVAQTIMVTYKGKPGAFAVRLHVTTDQAMCAGREIGGFPKNLGTIDFIEGTTFLSTLDSPTGLRICSGELDPMQPVQGPDDHATTFYSLRLIPNPVDATKPSVCQLIETVWELYGGKFWSARGLLHFEGSSGLNPYHSLPILQQMPPMIVNPQTDLERETPGVALFRGNMKITQVMVLEDF
jgi:acetoacetate decarboxylase